MKTGALHHNRFVKRICPDETEEYWLLVTKLQKYSIIYLKSVTNTTQMVFIRVKGLLIQRKGDEGFGRFENN